VRRIKEMDEERDILVPLVNSVVVNEDRFDLHGAEKDLVCGRSVVDIESDDGDFGSDIARRRKSVKWDEKCE
jgi:hypothetical protein